ncbi:hypothetical protein M427DRAFT_451855 [Gonapodya prolifera JEL478]|uniref:Uncharacterized protein n=1 Tax=Gonapodya prolifera (strain JEL478) TaxID=1344416 RepID=A0A139ARX1_GONPJ|nr:hypothetical protein M427DRAFT_451855 [Gonapodya prolifera JEL478]|eukprot:KXS19498.1 hypothetical protein M427DRAFT_451855 [Gonapodya prolifera JEL478]
MRLREAISNNPRLRALLERKRARGDTRGGWADHGKRDGRERASEHGRSPPPASVKSEPVWLRVDPASPRKRPGSTGTGITARSTRGGGANAVELDLEGAAARKLPFIMGTNTGKSYSVTANLQQIFAMLKSHNPVLCTICAARPRTSVPAKKRDDGPLPSGVRHDAGSGLDPRLADIRIADVGKHWPELRRAVAGLEGEVAGLRRFVTICRDVGTPCATVFVEGCGWGGWAESGKGHGEA